MEYLILFFSAFGAATLLPLYSELALVGFLTQSLSPLALWLVATTGNSLGSAVNWLLGRYLIKLKSSRWFPFKESQIEQAERWFNRYGIWSLLIAWVPIVGDPLTLIAGALRVRFTIFFTLVVLGKGVRYAVITIIYLSTI